MKKLLLIMCLVTMAFACKKKDPTPPTGGISGGISPAGAFSTIFATDTQGKQVSADVDATTGIFKINNLVAGTYQLSVPANPQYNAMGSLSVVVSSGKFTDAGNITFAELNPSTGNLSGTSLPAGFATSVTATDAMSGKTYKVVPDATGAFMITLPNGYYNISFSVKPPAAAPPLVSVTITGKAFNMGSVICDDSATGSVAGNISPFYGASSVKATDTKTGNFFFGTIDYSHGTFVFPVLLPGTYKLSFAAYVPYLPPADVTVVVTTGNATNAGTVTMPYNNDVRIISYNIDGVNIIRYNPACNFNNGLFSFTIRTVSFGSGPSIPGRETVTTTDLILKASNITGPGKYSFTGTDASNITLTQSSGISLSPNKTVTNWGVSGTAPVGELEITAIDQSARTIKGTFSATLVSDKPVANKTVTGGTFYLTY